MTSTLNIAALAKRTGVPADTIRKWETRYGVVRPERTPGGQRRYSEVDVARVEWLRARLQEGYRIGEAAALLGAGGTAAESAEELRQAIVAATLRSDGPALGGLVDQALGFGTLEESLLDVLAPALEAIGELWAAGEASVAQEHLASASVRAALQQVLADSRPALRGLAVLACAPGERHEIGLMMFAALARADGWQVAYLGADTPVGDAVTLARDLNATALCFSATMPEHAGTLEHTLKEQRPLRGTTVVVGGSATSARDPREVVSSLRKLAA